MAELGHAEQRWDARDLLVPPVKLAKYQALHNDLVRLVAHVTPVHIRQHEVEVAQLRWQEGRHLVEWLDAVVPEIGA